MSKRGSEHGQLRADEYEAVMNKDSAAPSGPFKKASEAEMGKRRIVKVSRRSRGGNTPNSSNKSVAGGTPMATPGSSKSSNPFASVNLAPPPASANPFSSVSFAPTPAASKPSSSSSGSGDLTSMKQLRDDRLKKLDAAFSAKNRRMREEGTTSHLLRDTNTYLSYRRAICEPVRKAEEAAIVDKALTTTPAPSGTSSTPATTKAPGGFSFGAKSSTPAPAPGGGFSFGTKASPAPAASPAAGTFSFGGAAAKSTPAPAASPATGGFSFGAAKATPAPAASPATGGFSFGGSTAAKATPAAAPGGFSFGSAAKPAPAPIVTAAPPATTDDATDGGIGISKPEAVEHLVDPDWKTIYDIDRVKYYIYEQDEESGKMVPKDYPSGPLRLEQGTKNPANRRMVVREPNAGRVRLNLAMATGMPFEATERKSKRTGKVTKFLMFYAIRDEAKGRERFLFQTATTEEHDKLVAKFTEMTKA